MKTALITIATGGIYRDYAVHMFRSARTFFPPHDEVVFTDEPSVFVGANAFYTDPKGYPRETLMRYHTILGIKDALKNYDQAFFVDADMLFVAPVGEEIFAEETTRDSGLTATLHPGYVGGVGTPERDKRSMAYLPFGVQNKYYCGGFQGGSAKAYIKAMEAMAFCLDKDLARGIIPVWHDESIWNCYLYFHPPSTVLSPEYCYPENAGTHYTDKWRAAGLGDVKPRLMALTKAGR
jgi:Glycosyltransferase family 6